MTWLNLGFWCGGRGASGGRAPESAARAHRPVACSQCAAEGRHVPRRPFGPVGRHIATRVSEISGGIAQCGMSPHVWESSYRARTGRLEMQSYVHAHLDFLLLAMIRQEP